MENVDFSAFAKSAIKQYQLVPLAASDSFAQLLAPGQADPALSP